MRRNDDPPEENWSDEHCNRCGDLLLREWDEEKEFWVGTGHCSEVCMVEDDARVMALRVQSMCQAMRLIRKTMSYPLPIKERERANAEFGRMVEQCAANSSRLRFLVNRLTDRRLMGPAGFAR